jgi:hypothetical protein
LEPLTFGQSETIFASRRSFPNAQLSYSGRIAVLAGSNIFTSCLNQSIAAMLE